MAATANITWDPASGAVSYKVEYKLQSSGTWTLYNSAVSGTTATITGLQEGSAYDFRVTTNCTTGTSGGVTVSGNTPCLDVLSLGVTIVSNSGNLSWSKKPNAAAYEIYYKLQSSSTYIAASGSPLTNSGAPDPVLFSVTGLTPGSAYDFKVIVDCIVGTSPGTTVSATSNCPNVTNLAVTFSS